MVFAQGYPSDFADLEPLEMTVDGEGSRVVRCRTVAHGRLQQVHHIRNLPVQMSAVDPLKMSAIEDEPDPLELLLSAFGSCLAAGIHANAIVRQIAITGLALDLSGSIDHAAQGPTSAVKPLGFETIAVCVHLESPALDEVLSALVRHAVLWSPIANTLYNPVHLKVTMA